MTLLNRTVQFDLIITIDGPSGAGKTTISKRLAQQLGYRYLDTGALYRAVALAAHKAGIDTDDDPALEALCNRIAIKFVQINNKTHLMLDEMDITDDIRTQHISMLASAVSARPVVRQSLLDIQRAVGQAKRVIAEGRDMGTVVFPNADIKFFLDATPQIRARRRHQELKVRGGVCPSLNQVEKEMIQRDKNDSIRQVAPLKAASDAIRIDSSSMTIDRVVSVMLDYILKKF